MPIKGKKSLPIAEEVHKRIARESVETGKDMYALVEEAWAAYESKAAGGVPERAIAENVLVRLDSEDSPTRESDTPWVEKLLQVLRSGNPSLVKLVQVIVTEFASVAGVRDEPGANQSAPISAEAASGRKRRTAAGELPRDAADRDTRSGDEAGNAGIDAEVDAIEEAQRQRREGTPRAPRKTG